MSPNSTSQQPSRAPESRNTASKLSQYPGLKAAITAAILAISGPAQGEIKKITQIGAGIDKNAERSLVVCDVDPQTLAATCEIEANIGDSIPHQAVTEIPGFGQVLVQLFKEIQEGKWKFPSRLVVRELKANGEIYIDTEVSKIPGAETMLVSTDMVVGAKGGNIAISAFDQLALINVAKNEATGKLEITEVNMTTGGSPEAKDIEFNTDGAAISMASNTMYKMTKDANGKLIVETETMSEQTIGGSLAALPDGTMGMFADISKVSIVNGKGSTEKNIQCAADLSLAALGTINGREVFVTTGEMIEGGSSKGVIVIQDKNTGEKKEHPINIATRQTPTITQDGEIIAGGFKAKFSGDPMFNSPAITPFTGPSVLDKVNTYEIDVQTIVTEGEPAVTPPDQNPEPTGSEVEKQTTEPVTAEPVEQKDAGSNDAGNTQAEEISSGAESPASEPNMAEEVSTGGDAGTSAEVGGGPNDADAGSTAPGGDAGNKLPPSVSADPGCQQGAGQKAPLLTLAGMVGALAALRRRGSKKAA